MSTTNNTNDLFIIAARKKFRFESSRGGLLTEDLFDLPLTILDNIAVALDEKIQKAGRKSFIEKRTASTTDLESQLEIVKFVIETKQAEAEAKKARELKASQREFLVKLREEKQLKKLEGQSLEEIEAQIKALDAQ